MNEGLEVYLNLDEKKLAENEDLIRKVDRLLLEVGMIHSGYRNMYRAEDLKDRDHAVFAACRVLKDAPWLKGIFAFSSILHLTNACSMKEIQSDCMTEPSAGKLEYYEKYYQETHKLAHGIVVDENKQLRDGYISYLIAKKYGINPDIYEAFTAQPLRKQVYGQHVTKDGDTWKVKKDKIYLWNYTLKAPVIPKDILEVQTKKGNDFICVRGITYVTGKEFCEEHKSTIKHMGERMV